MGLYDEVNFEMNCPICGQKVNDFQTKDVGFAKNLGNAQG